MISVITCVQQCMSESMQERNIRKTIGTEYEYIAIDNSTSKYGFAEAYSEGLQKAHGEIAVFIHEDAYFMKLGWGQVLENKFAKDSQLGIVGVAGTQYLFADNPSLTAAGRPFTKGRMIHDLQNGDFFAAVFSPENGDFEVVACDGVFMAVRGELFSRIWWDYQTFRDTSFHDIDMCMQARITHRILVTTEIVVKKRTLYVYDVVWHENSRKFLDKYSSVLPVSCASQVPDLNNRIAIQSVDLKGKAPQQTIV